MTDRHDLIIRKDYDETQTQACQLVIVYRREFDIIDTDRCSATGGSPP